MRGNDADAKERNVAIEILTADGRPLFTVALEHLGIFRMGVDASAAGDQGRRARVEMHVEEMALAYGRLAAT